MPIPTPARADLIAARLLPSDANVESCPSCGSGFTTQFCPDCGERRPSTRHYSLRSFAGEAIETFTQADGRFPRTLALLIRRPGELTAAYMRGARVRYVAPLQLFLLANLLYFVSATWIGAMDTFNTPLVTQRAHLPYSALASRLIDARVAALHTTLAMYEPAFNAATTTLAKTLVIAMVPAFAVLLAVLTLGRARHRALQHLVYALHTYAALFVIILAATYVVGYPGELIVRLTHAANGAHILDAFVLTPVLAAALLVYHARGLRRAYGLSRLRATLTAAALVLGMGYVLTAYRFLLLVVTLRAT